MPIKATAIIILIVGSAWAYLGYQSWQMTQEPMSNMRMLPAVLMAWTWIDFLWVYGMWAIMMAAMMLPSALPMLTAFSRYCARLPASNEGLVFWVCAGYLAVWLIFSIVLTTLQWLFHGLDWLSPMMENRKPWLAAVILAAAGLYQFLPLKNDCLKHCRTPFGFLVNEWRPGQSGALLIGYRHGLMCLGCCWAQMLIMFAVGVMNLLGMAAITLLVIMEKWAPCYGRKMSFGIGALFLLGAACYLLA